MQTAHLRKAKLTPALERKSFVSKMRIRCQLCIRLSSGSMHTMYYICRSSQKSLSAKDKRAIQVFGLSSLGFERLGRSLNMCSCPIKVSSWGWQRDSLLFKMSWFVVGCVVRLSSRIPGILLPAPNHPPPPLPTLTPEPHAEIRLSQSRQAGS